MNNLIATIEKVEQNLTRLKNCGIGSGGFQSGNSCARGGGGGSSSSSGGSGGITKEGDAAISSIAKKRLGIGTLKTQNSDSLDFHTVGVAGVKGALTDAYSAAGGKNLPKGGIESIAKKHLGIKTLKTQNSNSLDFHEVSVGAVKKALTDSYRLGGGGTHSVKLPKNSKKLGLPATQNALSQMGYKMDIKKSGFNLKTKIQNYNIVKPDGSESLMTAADLNKLIYERQSG